jgi:hypothetical protein
MRKLHFHNPEAEGFLKGKGQFLCADTRWQFLQISIYIDLNKLYFFSSAFYSEFVLHTVIERLLKK